MADTNITARFVPNPVPQFFATDGTPAAGYKLYHFNTGLTTDKDIWTEEVDTSDEAHKHAQPIVLNSRGEVPGGMFGTGKYTFVLIPPTGPADDDYSDAIWTINDVDAVTIQDYVRETIFACADAAAVRSALGLNDAALLDDVQGEAGNVVVYDENGRYPAEDGRNIENVVTVVSGTWTPTPPLPRSYLAGLKITRASAVSITVEVGVCRDVDDGANIEVTTPITKLTNAVFAEGNNAGGTLGGAAGADTWYHVFLIKKSSDGTVDVVFSSNATLPTPPTGFDIKRRIGAFMTDATPEVLDFTQRGDYFWFNAIQEDESAKSVGTSDTTITLDFVPTTVLCDAILNVLLDKTASADISLMVFPTTMTAETPSGISTTAPDAHVSPGFTFSSDTTGDQPCGGQIIIPLNSSKQFTVRASEASCYFYVWTLGWIDRRGRDD